MPEGEVGDRATNTTTTEMTPTLEACGREQPAGDDGADPDDDGEDEQTHAPQHVAGDLVDVFAAFPGATGHTCNGSRSKKSTGMIRVPFEV